MQIQDLYLAFIAGRQLPNLGTRTARALLDMARSALLSRGKRLKPSSASDPAAIKQELLQAHRELVPGPEIYCMAATEPTLMNGISNDKLLDEFERFKRTNPNGSLLQHLTTLHSDSPAPAAKSAPITRPATTTVPPKATTPKSVMPIAPKTKATTTHPSATPPPRKESTDEYLARRVAEQALARPAAVAAAQLVELRPLKEVSNAELMRLARHDFASPAEKTAALSEIANRPNVTLFARSYSVSYPSKK